METINHQPEKKSIFQIFKNIQKYWNHLLANWRIILIVGFAGGVIGLISSFIIKPKYTATVSFALIEGGGNKGGLMDIASSFGLASMLGGNDVFSGDNLLEIIKSKYAIEQTLLTPVDYKGKKENLIEAYIDFNHLRNKWSKSKKPGLRNLQYPIGQARNTFSREQDSILHKLSKKFILNNDLQVTRKSKKLAMSDVSFTCTDEVFSKLFVENLMNETYKFYKDTKTAQSSLNLNKMIHTADSIRSLYENALSRSSMMSRVNINQALQIALVPKLKQENDAQLYATVYAEVLKNLETVKLDLARETPIVQVIDSPIYPLEVVKVGRVKGPFMGGLYSGVLVVLYLIISLFISEIKEEEIANAEKTKSKKDKKKSDE